MTTATKKKKLHDFIDTADDQQVKAVFSIFEDQMGERYDHWNDEYFLKELKSRIDDIESGKTEGIPWEEVKRKSRERLAAKKQNS